MKTKCIIVLSLVINLASTFLYGTTYYVSTTGNDNNNDGSESSPWGTIRRGVTSLTSPGDTLIIRGGTYRELTSIYNFAYSGTEQQSIKLKAYPGEKVIITGMDDAHGTTNWLQVSGNIYRLNGGTSGNVYNVSQDGVPLKLMVPYNNYSGSYSDLTGEGQWTRNTSTGDIWVWAKGGGNPGNYSIEFGKLYALFQIQDFISYIHFENLTIEGAYYPVYIKGDYCKFENCIFRNCFGDAFKVGDPTDGSWNSTNGEVINCDMYYFGENGIDITGGDYWRIKNCVIHDGIKNRAASEQIMGSKLNGIILKNNNIGTSVEGCRIFNIEGPFGAIMIGGDTYYAGLPSAEDLIVKNNIIHDIKAPYIISFMGAKNCKLTNNIVYDCDATNTGVSNASEALIEFDYGIENHEPPNYTYYYSNGNEVLNNIFYNNVANYNYKEVYDSQVGSNDADLVLDYNIVNSSRNSSFDGTTMSHNTMVTVKGYDTNSQTGTPSFIDYSSDLIRLADYSTGVDDGTVVNDVIYDYSGIERFLGEAFDIGPYENITYSIYSDGSDASNWVNMIPSVVTDSTLGSSVLSFTSTGTGWLFDSNGQAWNNTTQFVISFKAKADQKHAFAVRLKTMSGVWKTLKYYSWYTTNDFSNPLTLRFPLGTGSSSTEDNNWHNYIFDLEANLREAIANDEIDFIERFYIENSDSQEIRIDDIELHNTTQSAETPKDCIGEWNFDGAYGSKAEDTSGENRHGTLSNMETTNPMSRAWIIGKKGKAIQFGTTSNSCVSIPNLTASFTRGLTISAWVKYNNITDTYKAIVSGLTGNGYYPRLYQNGSGIYLQIPIDGNLVRAYSDTGYIPIGEWTHIAVVVDMTSKTITTYIDGTIRGTVTSFTETSIDTGTYQMYLGNDASLTKTFSGCMDEVKLYNRALSAEEIAFLAE